MSVIQKKQPDIPRRAILKTAGAAMIAGWTASVAFDTTASAKEQTISAMERNNGPLGVRLQGVQHFGLTVQNMDRAFQFYTEVVGGAEIMRDTFRRTGGLCKPCWKDQRRKKIGETPFGIAYDTYFHQPRRLTEKYFDCWIELELTIAGPLFAAREDGNV